MKHHNFKHGHTVNFRPTKTYTTWISMCARCVDPSATSYPRYGARGIKVCPRWKSSFENFLEDMGEKPLGLTLERINSNGDYEPSNCRWATVAEQRRNCRNTINLTFNRETLCLADWATRLGVNYGALYLRLRKGWSFERTLTQPLRIQPGRKTKNE